MTPNLHYHVCPICRRRWPCGDLDCAGEPEMECRECLKSGEIALEIAKTD